MVVAPHRIRLATATALAAAALALASCGGSDDGEGGRAPAPGSEGAGSVDQRPGEAGAPSGANSTSGGGDAEGGGESAPAGGEAGSGAATGDGGEAAGPAPVGDDESGPFIGVRRGVATDFLVFGVPSTEPRRLEVSSDAILVDLTWRGWGTARATATGAARVNTCVPTCAEGKIERRPGAGAVVSGLQAGECQADPGGSARFYTRVAIQFPPGLDLPARQSVSLFARCVDGG